MANSENPFEGLYEYDGLAVSVEGNEATAWDRPGGRRFPLASVLDATELDRDGFERLRQRFDPIENTLAPLSCAQCARGFGSYEIWRAYFVDIGEVALFCPHCAEREFGYPRA